jgi:4-hydroxy-4-methyl-2-oxoglutarate aldolase
MGDYVFGYDILCRMRNLDMKHSPNERQTILDLYRDLRVADVRDGMDWMMRRHQGSMSPDVRPLFRTRAVGIAKTARYVPYAGSVPTMSPDEYTMWVDWYYREICPYPWIEDLREGDFCVIDQSGVDSGLMGSNNSLAGFAKGARGYVTNGGVRDTDELIIQKVPFWSRFISQSMVQGRLQFDAHDIPVVVSGVLVYPGDVVIADGDGVIVVPQDIALDVAKCGRRELENDKASRRRMYEELGMELDRTVK